MNVGLDIGEHSLKCAVVETQSGRIQDLWQAELFPERASHDQVLEGEALRKRLDELLRKCGAECAGFKPRVITAVQGAQTGTGYIELPPLSSEEIQTAVTSQAIRQIPFPIENVTLSHVSVPPIDGKKKKKGFFFVAAHENLVEKLKKILEGCNVEVLRVGVPALALVNEFSRNHVPPPGKFVVLVHLGFRLTHVVILRDGYPYWSRDFSPAGRDFTYGFQVARDQTWKKAEVEMRNPGLSLADLDIEPQLIRWVREIKKSLDFFATHFSQKKLTFPSAFLSGGGSILKGLDRYLSHRLGIPVKRDEWNRVHPARKKNKASLSPVSFKIAVGLALER